MPSTLHAGPGVKVFMIFGFIDFEATGVDPKTAHIIEWALVRYCSEQKQVLTMHTNLVALPAGETLSEEITELTGITPKMLETEAFPFVQMGQRLTLMADHCDYLVAHNGLSYDRLLFTFNAKRWGTHDLSKPWIDTMTDIPYPTRIKSRNLVTLCAEHGFLNPLAHRAMSDCISLWKLFTQYDPVQIVEIASTPMLTVRADVPFQKKDLAKKAGYGWDAERKIWIKPLREYYLKQEKASVPFPVLILS